MNIFTRIYEYFVPPITYMRGFRNGVEAARQFQDDQSFALSVANADGPTRDEYDHGWTDAMFAVWRENGRDTEELLKMVGWK